MLKKILEQLPDSELILIDGHDNAVVGLVETADGLHLLYKVSVIFENLIKVHGFESYQDCQEWYQFNMLDLSRLEYGPVFLEDTIVE